MDRSGFFKAAAKLLFQKGSDFLTQNPLQILEGLVASSNHEEPPYLDSRHHRPPGACAVDLKFKSLCTGCDACMAACPVNVIIIDDLELRYPLICPEIAPCIHCEDYPCIQACPSGALDLSNLKIR